MQSNFEYAYYLYLSGSPFREKMIDYAVEWISSGNDGENISVLACSDYEDDIGLVEIFRNAAKEVGANLPTLEQQQDWMILKRFQFEFEGREMQSESIDELFRKSMEFVFIKLCSKSEFLDTETMRQKCLTIAFNTDVFCSVFTTSRNGYI